LTRRVNTPASTESQMDVLEKTKSPVVTFW
jgi:hypothetical protein